MSLRWARQPSLDMVDEGQFAPLDDLFTPRGQGRLPPATRGEHDQRQHLRHQDDRRHGLLYARKSMLEGAGIAPPTTMDELIAAAPEARYRAAEGPLPRQRRRDRCARITSRPGRPAATSSTRRPIRSSSTTSAPPSPTQAEGAERYRRPAARRPDRLVGPVGLHPGPGGDVSGRPLGDAPGITAELGDDFSVVPWPALDAEGHPGHLLGGWSELVNGKTAAHGRAKSLRHGFGSRTPRSRQTEPLLRLPRAAAQSAAAAAEPLKTGPASEAVGFLGRLRPRPAAVAHRRDQHDRVGRSDEHRQERCRRHRRGRRRGKKAQAELDQVVA